MTRKLAQRKRGRYAYQPDTVLPPGETLRETLDALGMSQAELSLRAGLSAMHVNQIVQGTTLLSHETAIALERVTDVPAQLWNSLEAQYRDQLARQRERDEMGDQTAWLSRIPINALRRMGVVTAYPHDEPAVVQEVLRFFGVASVSAWESFWRDADLDRRPRAFAAYVGVLATWLRLGEREARQRRCDPFHRERLRGLVPELRALTVEPVERIRPELRRLCGQAGVAVVIVPEVPGCRASGATRWLSPHKAMLALSVRHKRNDQLWFAFFHALGHILLHGKREQFIEDDKPSEDPKEEQADRFAADALIPEQYTSELMSLRSQATIKAFADRVGIAPGIVVGRLQRDEIIGYNVGHALFETYGFVD